VVEPSLPTPSNHPRGSRQENLLDGTSLTRSRMRCTGVCVAEFRPNCRRRRRCTGTSLGGNREADLPDGRRAAVPGPRRRGRDPHARAGLRTLGQSRTPKPWVLIPGVMTRGRRHQRSEWFIVTVTLALLLVVLVLPASVQDRDGAKKLLLDYIASFCPGPLVGCGTCSLTGRSKWCVNPRVTGSSRSSSHFSTTTSKPTA
jgi:hypothetical protein